MSDDTQSRIKADSYAVAYKDFSKRAAEAAREYSLGEVDTCHRVDFLAGAQWSRAETIKEVLEALRSDEALHIRMATGVHRAADWLEQKFGGEK